ncbi:MAG: M56 family metallopeptidase [Patescibacteria group bacterium]|jgi:hypothetical protein
MNIAKAIHRFLISNCILVLTTIWLTLSLGNVLKPFLQNMVDRWLGYKQMCGCANYALFPTDTAGRFVLGVFIIAVIGLIIFSLNAIIAFIRTKLYQTKLSSNHKRHTFYQGIQINYIDSNETLAVCVGYIRPQVYISRGLIARLDGFELLAVIQHEVAHAKSFDPLKRLFIGAVPIWYKQYQRYVTAQEVLADNAVVNTTSIRSAFVKVVEELCVTPGVSASFFSTSQARINVWLGERLTLPSSRSVVIGLSIIITMLLFSYRTFAAEPEMQAFGQCLTEQNMCRTIMTYVVS